MRRSLTKQERLSRRSDIKRVFSSSRRHVCGGMKLLERENGLGRNRIAVSFVRGFGTAVERNTAKRRVREIYRNSKHSFVQGYDMIFILYPGAFSFLSRKQQMQSLLNRAGLLRDTNWSNNG